MVLYRGRNTAWWWGLFFLRGGTHDGEIWSCPEGGTQPESKIWSCLEGGTQADGQIWSCPVGGTQPVSKIWPWVERETQPDWLHLSWRKNTYWRWDLVLYWGRNTKWQWALRCSVQLLWSLLSSWMWLRAFLEKFTDVSEQPHASMFKTEKPSDISLFGNASEYLTECTT